MKKIIITSIISAVIFSSITAYAITKYNSDQVLYQKGKEQITVTNALDELYENMGNNVVFLGSGNSIDVSLLFPDTYQMYTVDDFICEAYTGTISTSGSGRSNGGAINGSGSNSAQYNINKSYNNGIFKVTLSGSTSQDYKLYHNGDVYGQGSTSASTSISFRIYLIKRATN